MIIDYIRIGLKNLSRRKLRSWLTMLGIIVGIASVIALIGLGNGLQAAITGQFGSISADVLTVQASGLALSGPPGTGVVTPLDKDLEEIIETVPGVEFAAGRLIGGAKAEFNDITAIEYLVSLPEGPKGKQLLSILALETDQGRMIKDGDASKVVLGHNFNKPDNEFGKAIQVRDTIYLNDRRFEVVGIMEAQGSFIIDNAIFMMEEPMREVTGKPENIDIIAVKVKSIGQVDKVKVDIEKALRKERGVKEGEEDFSVESAESVIESVTSILGGVQAFVIIIAMISMVVGAIGIVNTMFTAVLERRKEIGIMKSIGGQRKDIFWLFLIESGLIGAVGGAIGIALGEIAAFLGTVALNNLLGTEVAPQTSIILVGSALIGSFLLGAASGIIPAMQAMRLSPVQALRS